MTWIGRRGGRGQGTGHEERRDRTGSG